MVAQGSTELMSGVQDLTATHQVGA
jgi:hypothetical protein